MNDPQLILAAALLLSLVGTAFAAYERGYSNGRKSQQCADELALAMESGSRTRHPSRCEDC